jgi:hypothetical protein
MGQQPAGISLQEPVPHAAACLPQLQTPLFPHPQLQGHFSPHLQTPLASQPQLHAHAAFSAVAGGVLDGVFDIVE